MKKQEQNRAQQQEQNQEQNQGKKKDFRSIASATVLVVAVLFSLILSVQVVLRGYAGVAGYSVFRVITGSMEPTLAVDSLVLAKKTAITDIKVDDIVVFFAPTGSGESRIVTHRVVSIGWNEYGAVELETRGDANPVADSDLVTGDDLIGKVVWYTEEEGGVMNIVSFISSKFGFIACIAFPILLLGGLILRACIASIQNEIYRVSRELDLESEKALEEAGHVSAEEYQEIYQRIKAELLEEQKKNHEQG